MKDKFFILLFFISVFLMGFLPVKDTDFGWHYRCGNQFLTSGKLCLTNEFSYFLPNYKAYYSGHLYDIFLAFVFNHGGFVTISIIGGLIFAFSALLFLRLTQTDLPIKIIGFFIIFFLSFHVFSLGLRPQIFSYLFFIFLLFLLKDKKSQMLFAIPLFFLFWVNIHIGFFIGLIVLAFYVVVVGNGFKPFLTLIFFLSFLATLINPFGIFVYKEIFNHALSPLSSMIAEWVRPDMLQIVFIMVLGGMAVIKILKTKSFSLYYFFLVLFFGLLALQARRNLPFFYTVFFYVVFYDFKLQIRSLTDLMISLLVTIIAFVGIIQTPKTIQFNTSWETYCNQGIIDFPCQAINKYPKLSGNVYATYEWGGFLIWQKPEMKVFVDGRMPAWKDENGKSPYQVYLDIIQTQPGWNEKLRSLKTDYIFISNGTFLDLLLEKDASKFGWKEVYRDNLAVIYKNIL